MKNKPYIIIIGVLLLALTIYLVATYDAKPRYDWSVSYAKESKEPYGLSVFYQILQDYFPNRELHQIEDSLSIELNSLDVENEEISSYVFMGNYLAVYDWNEINALLDYIARGNRAFILANDVSVDLRDELFLTECLPWDDDDNYAYQTDSAVRMNFYHPEVEMDTSCRLAYTYHHYESFYYWRYFDPYTVCDTLDIYAALGYFDTDSASFINFFRVPYGDGYFYFHTLPLAFTNYNVVNNEKSREYLERVLAHMPEGNIYWDDYHDPLYFSNNPFGPKNINEESPLRFILSQDGLRWAWYLMIFLVLIYLVFLTQRRQRIVPVIEPNTNTSLEFVNTIGRIYFQQQNHKKLAEEKAKMFLAFIRSRYGISTKEEDKELIQKIALKSQVPAKDVEIIFNHIKVIEEADDLQDFILSNFHFAIDKFYKNCK